MKIKDSYEDRLLMVKMHDDILARIDNAIKKKHGVDACWLCYACLESRITRTLEKVSENCCERLCYQNKRMGIQKKMDCLKRLLHLKYLGIELFDLKLFGEIKVWCKTRNDLVHALLTLNHYHDIDNKFLSLAREGALIVKKLYAQTTDFRNHYYTTDELPPFPQAAMEKCELVKRRRKNARKTQTEAQESKTEK